MTDKIFALKGNICFNESPHSFSVNDHSYVICDNGISKGVYSSLPEKYAHIPVYDFHDHIIIPGLCDLHLHAPQYSYRGMGMDLELLDWLNTYAFPEESKFTDLDYAQKAYSIFTEDLKKSPTTRASIFATLHVPATELLMKLLDSTGIIAYVGKVNMDRNGIESLQEKSPQISASDTIRWIENTQFRFQNVKPILTPRFIPSCTDSLMEKLQEIQKTYHLPVQSHLSENLGEISWVKELCPDTTFYGEAYDKYNLFGGTDCPTLMAHCVHCPEEELELIKKRGVYMVHCPQSNTNLASGIAPLRHYLNNGLKIGLGSDIAGGAHLSLFRTIADTIQMSKLYWRLVDKQMKPVTLEEAMYLATEGGGSFFGKTGSFKIGYEFDALVLDDKNLPYPQKLNTIQRLERMIYLGSDQNIKEKFVFGKKIF